jgi:two-component system, NarL family, response regulator NreC
VIGRIERRPARPPCGACSRADAAAVVRVVLADDHATMLRVLHDLLDRAPEVAVVGETAVLAEAIELSAVLQPHIVVLDLGMLRGRCSETLDHLGERAPVSRVVILTMQDDPAFAQHVLDSGACGYLLKEHAGELLVDAVQGVARGEACRWDLPGGAARRSWGGRASAAP